MFIAYVVIAVLGAVMLTLSASLKLRGDERSISVIHDVIGVPMTWFPWLAGCELAGATGLLVGIAWAPIGVAAAVGVVAYFVLAIGSHIRVNDLKGIGSPAIPLGFAVAALVTRIGSM